MSNDDLSKPIKLLDKSNNKLLDRSDNKSNKLIALTHSDHIKKNQGIYIGDNTDKVVLSAKCNYVSVDAKYYKLITELLHNAFDHVYNEVKSNANITIIVNNKSIVIRNTTSRSVTEKSIMYGKEKDMLVLDLILDTIHTSSHYEDRQSTAGMFGLGLKVVVSLIDSIKVRLDDKVNVHTKVYTNSVITSNIIKPSNGNNNLSYFEVTISNTLIDSDVLQMLVIEQVLVGTLTNKVHVESQMIINSETININYTPYEIITSYFLNQEDVQLLYVDVELEDKSNVVLYLGIGLNKTIESRIIINGIHTYMSPLMNLCFQSIYNSYKKQYSDTTITVEMLKTRIRLIGISCGWKCTRFTSNDKVKLLTKAKLMKEIKLCPKISIQIESILKANNVKKILNSINLKKTKEYNPPSKTYDMLWIVEGESARSGIGIAINKSSSGIYVLRGKILNADKKESKLQTNNPLLILNKIISTKPFYQRLIIACDPDPDGFHIVGLMINYLARLNIIDKIYILMLPLYKQGNQYYYIHPSSSKPKIKYFKGLGSYSSDEMRNLLSTDNYLFKIKLNGSYDEDNDYQIFRGFFAKSSHIRKIMYNQTDPFDSNELTQTKSIKFELLCKMMKTYMLLSLERALPQIDGLNRTRRKIIYGSQDYKNLTKVNVLGGHITEKTDYAHGDVSLHNVIIKMAQTYPCSNWINLMKDEGAFGSRRCRGNDASQPRYLYTCLTPLARKIFTDEYKDIIKSTDNGEPELYLPLYPLLIINGAIGIGAGFSTLIPPHNPKDVIEYYNNKLLGNECIIPSPSYNGFNGKVIVKDYEDREVISFEGNAILQPNGWLHITELPPYYATDKFVEWLIKNDYNYRNNSYPNTIDIEVEVNLICSEPIDYRDIDIDYKDINYNNIIQLLKQLKQDTTVNCTILHKNKVMTLSREELFEFWYKNALYYMKLLRAKQLRTTQHSIDILKAKIWCIKLLMVIEFKTMNTTEKQINYLRTFDHTIEYKNLSHVIDEVITTDFRISQLTINYINHLDDEINKLETDMIYFSHPYKKLLLDRLIA